MRAALNAARFPINVKQTRKSLRYILAHQQYPAVHNQQPWHPNAVGNQRRGAKTKATVNLGDLPQGSVGGRGALEEAQDEGPTYPPVVQQAWNNMQKFENCVVLTRVGSFYELYLEQADNYGPLLNLKVAKKKTTAGPVSMAGFPFYQLDRFLKILVQELNESVAISEEFANNASGKVKSGGAMFNRKIVRVITPGTLIDEKFMNPYENNYLLAIAPPEALASQGVEKTAVENTAVTADPRRAFGLAWLDLSTGDFFTETSTEVTLPSALARIGASEIVLDNRTAMLFQQRLGDILGLQRHLMTQHQAHDEELPVAQWTPMLEAAVPFTAQAQFTAEEVRAGNLLLSYVREKLQGLNVKLQPPVRRQNNETMRIDKNSLRGLEVLETSRDGIAGGKGSLLHSVRRTVTKGGTRLLKNWIASPSMSLDTINARLDLVSHFLADRGLREDITELLRRTHDSQRLVQKFSLGRGDADDLLSLLRTIEATVEAGGVLTSEMDHLETNESDLIYRPRSQALGSLIARLSFDKPKALASSIAEAIDEDGLMQTHRNEEKDNADVINLAQDVLQSEGSKEDREALPGVVKSKASSKAVEDRDSEETEPWIMRKSASPTMMRLHIELGHLYQEKLQLTHRLRSLFGAHSLTLRWAPGLGHFCHIKGVKDVRSSMQTSVSTRDVKFSKSTRSFHFTDWNRLGSRLDQAKLQIRAEEQRVFQDLREQVVTNLVQLRRNAAVLDELDIACSFAVLAEEQGFVRPNVNDKLTHQILGGRHPTVKLGLEREGRAFVSNDCLIGGGERIWLVTGPNMGGKSTFLRQNGLISILAQVGSFVPADHADIGLVDQIFTRIGSGDDLFRDQSTFMVEMLETAAILNQATPRSFVIMDEIGRGTTPEDGIAIGFACLYHLYHKSQCRTLFATHFHALADMTRSFERLGRYCTDVEEDSTGSFSYVHRLRRGVNRQSHALKVARLAGVPAAAIKVAEDVLENFSQRPLTPFEGIQTQAVVA